MPPTTETSTPNGSIRDTLLGLVFLVLGVFVVFTNEQRGHNPVVLGIGLGTAVFGAFFISRTTTARGIRWLITFLRRDDS